MMRDSSRTTRRGDAPASRSGRPTPSRSTPAADPKQAVRKRTATLGEECAAAGPIDGVRRAGRMVGRPPSTVPPTTCRGGPEMPSLTRRVIVLLTTLTLLLGVAGGA